jgi:hypothetical protein
LQTGPIDASLARNLRLSTFYSVIFGLSSRPPVFISSSAISPTDVLF